MPHIPEMILKQGQPIEGLELRNRGKVRDTYNVPGYPEEMLVIASDRCSIFDFVLNTFIPHKGYILNALNIFWSDRIKGWFRGDLMTDLVASGECIDFYLPEPLRGNADLQKRATAVHILTEPDIEDIVRLYLTGSGWSSYEKTREVCGHKLPKGLQDGSRLPEAIYTPTTKAKVGHDEHVSAESIRQKYGPERERLSLEVAKQIAEYAYERGIILADTKFEFSYHGGKFILADEKGTPDSSRFWDAKAWEKAAKKGKPPQSFDKQFVREWGKTSFIEKDETGRKREPENPDDLEFVDNQVLPDKIVRQTTNIYRYIFWRLTGKQLEVYQRERMGIDVLPKKRKIELLLGSRSDLDQIQAGLAAVNGKADISVNIVSCHRNVAALADFAKNGLTEADVVVAGAGMAAALPGIVKSHLCANGFEHIPVIGVACEGATDEDNLAAKLSITRLPSQPVELRGNGHVYFGGYGFVEALKSAVNDEFLTRSIEYKEAEFGITRIV